MNIVSSLLITGASPVTVGGTGATLKFFPSVAGTTPLKRGCVYCPGESRANGQRLYVRASGNFRSAAALSIGLYAVTSPSSSPLLLGSDAFNGCAFTGPWMFSAELAGDSDSGIVQGIFSMQCVEHTNSLLRPLNVMRNINFKDDIPYALAMGVMFSNSDAKNTASMFQFDLLQ